MAKATKSKTKNKGPKPAEIIAGLQGSNSAVRQKMLKHISKKKLDQYGDVVLTMLRSLNALPKGTKSIFNDIYYAEIALGDINYTPAISFLDELARKRGGDLGAAVSYLRLTRKDNSDFSGCFHYIDECERLLQAGIRTTMEMGAFMVINNDKMVPPDPEITQEFIKRAWYVAEHTSSSRVLDLITSACAGLKPEDSRELLCYIYEVGKLTNSYLAQYTKDAAAGIYHHFDPNR